MTSSSHRLAALATVLALAVPSAAQHVNVDFGAGQGTPSIRGAACAPDHWTTVTSFPTNTLPDHQGGGSTIWLDCTDPVAFESGFGPSSPTGDTAPLYNDYLIVDALKTITVNGLDPLKTYQIFVYAWDPDEVATEVKVGGQATWAPISGTNPAPQFPHQRIITYWAKLVLTSGVSSVDVQLRQAGGVPGNVGACNGLQIREMNSIGVDDPSCNPGPWSAGGPATLTAYGSESQTVAGALDMGKDDAFLRVVDAKPDYAIFIMSMNTAGSGTIPEGAPICMGNPIVRLPINWTDGGGICRSCLDYGDDPTSVITSGQTWAFQLWFRDPAPPQGTGLGAWTSTSVDITFD